MRLTNLFLVSIAWIQAAPITGELSQARTVELVAADTSAVQPVPEPTTWLMLTAGMLLMGMSLLRNRRAGLTKAAGVKVSGKFVSER